MVNYSTWNNPQFEELMSSIDFNIDSFPYLVRSDDKSIIRDIFQTENWDTWYAVVDIREIIFSPMFIKALEKKFHERDLLWTIDWKRWLIDNIEDPISYLLKII